jgi:hypothetical protein
MFEAAIPPTSSAIKVGGGQGECARLTLDCYVNTDLNELASLRGKQLRVIIGPIERMNELSEFIEHEPS